jgi:pantetheine-phosphate adenylyltransferase
MQKTAVFPGSFDPFTIGHNSIVERAIPLFDKIIIAIGTNESKKEFFPLNKRKNWIEKIFFNQPKVEVALYNGLTIDFCKKIDAGFILRGLRTSSDFEYERAIGQVNKILCNSIETVYLLTLPEHSAISSSIVREIIKHNADARKLLPKIIADDIILES